MTERFFYFADSIILSLGAGGALLLCLAILSIAFVAALFLALFRRGYSLKKRSWFAVLSAGLCIFELAVCLISVDSVGYALILLSISVIFCAPVYSIRVKDKITEEQRDLIKFIDGEIYGKSHGEPSKDKDIIPISIDQPDTQVNKETDKDIKTIKPCDNAQKDKKNKVKELDFTHVKNVISRLSYFELSPTDKKQVKDLEAAVYSAENDVFTTDIKNRINDGLGALLKIMAKHGV